MYPLSLQGIPIDDLLLTRESTDQLADLAGNAMSTTIVGTALLSALLLGRSHLVAFEQEKPAVLAPSRAAITGSPTKMKKQPGAPCSPAGGLVESHKPTEPVTLTPTRPKP